MLSNNYICIVDVTPDPFHMVLYNRSVMVRMDQGATRPSMSPTTPSVMSALWMRMILWEHYVPEM